MVASRRSESNVISERAADVVEEGEGYVGRGGRKRGGLDLYHGQLAREQIVPFYLRRESEFWHCIVSTPKERKRAGEPIFVEKKHCCAITVRKVLTIKEAPSSYNYRKHASPSTCKALSACDEAAGVVSDRVDGGILCGVSSSAKEGCSGKSELRV